jgi:hypothetical protein
LAVGENIKSRLRAATKRAGAEGRARRGYSLEQLIAAAHGEELGPPAVVLKPGQKSLEELILACVPPASRGEP